MIQELLKVAQKSRNLVDDLASAMVESMRYCDSSVDYPDFSKVKPDDGVVAEWFYPIINGDNDFSELSANLDECSIILATACLFKDLKFFFFDNDPISYAYSISFSSVLSIKIPKSASTLK